MVGLFFLNCVGYVLLISFFPHSLTVESLSYFMMNQRSDVGGGGGGGSIRIL